MVERRGGASPRAAHAGGVGDGGAWPDPHDSRRVLRADGALAAFNDARVLEPSDVHVAATLGRLCGEGSEAALLAAALAVRAPRLGHVCVDLATVRGTVSVDEEVPVDVDALPWPQEGWIEEVAGSRLAAAGDPAAPRPLRLAGTRLYLDRYWGYEQQVLEHLRARSAVPAVGVDVVRLRRDLDRLFPSGGQVERPDLQRVAATAAVLRRLAVVAGGPGTGKTTTVARVLALLAGQGPGLPRVSLTAPTGKAADRVEKAVHASASELPVGDTVRAWLLRLEGSTIHRLLGRRPGSDTRFRHDRRNPLPVDVVVVDETSMVSLALMAKLLDAVSPRTRLVLLGDPHQLASVEAGAVLGDIVGPTSTSLRMTAAARADLAAAAGEDVPAEEPPAGASVGDGIVVLRRIHRFGQESGIAALAAAVKDGDPAAAAAVLEGGRDDVAWLPGAGDEHGRASTELAPVRAAVVAAGEQVLAAARAGEAARALEALGGLRVLCVHRRGPYGVSSWVQAIEQWLAQGLDGYDTTAPWYLGRPVLVTRNDYRLGLYNGDVGVVVADEEGHATVAFEGAEGVRRVSPTRLEAYETVHAMTVHKSQGSQFRDVVVVLPEPSSPALSRELLYTAATRAERHLTLVGTAETVRTAVERPIQRASGLRAALWG